MKPIQPLPAQFQFAGLTFPKYAWTLPKGSTAQRLSRAKQSCCGPYYGSPRPNQSKGACFYLECDFMPRLRWKWADDCKDVRRAIDHKGWYCDRYQDQTIRGIVMRLPKNRGFLAGWSMGQSMASEIGSEIHETEREAALAADREAELVAKKKRDRQEQEEHQEQQERERELVKTASELED